MEFSVSSLSIQEPSSGSTGEPRPPCKASQGSQPLRPSQGSKPPSPDALGAARKEEEASFWKINAERSRGEGPQAEFQSLTPSQIKSMEKGEKVLPLCYRQDPTPRDTGAKEERPGHLRQEPRVLPGASAECEGPPLVPAYSSTLGEATCSEPVRKLPSPGAVPGDAENTEDFLFSEPVPAEVGTQPLPPGVAWEASLGRAVGCRHPRFLPHPPFPCLLLRGLLGRGLLGYPAQ